ncbi:MAG: hypothetical protein HYY84_15970 [Deltaproteobacteria bacterium]|nr:hypothetical protein [Deltaproteobacteria bacterium]
MYAPNSFRAMLRLSTGFTPASFFWTSVMAAGALGGCGYVLMIEVHIAAAVPLWALGCAGPLFFLFTLLRYPSYVNWRRRLPFSVEGDFDRLAGDRSATDGWRASAIHVDLEEPTAENILAVEAALRVFAVRANRSMYKTQWGRIDRWQAKELGAAGDANARVAWKMIRLIAGDLRDLHRSGARVRSVTVEVADKSRHVMAETDTMT